MTAQVSVNLDEKKISEQVSNIRTIATRDSWIFDYDKDVDQMFYAPKVLPKDTFLISFNDEISLYLNKKSDIKGVFIEYFSHNFVQHDKNIQPAMKIILKMQKYHTKEMKTAEQIITQELEKKTIEAVYSSISNISKVPVSI